MSERLLRLSALVSAGAVGLGAFLVQFGPASLDPFNLHWLMSADWGQHLLGWLMFRQSEWSWPLGAIPGLAWPIGASLGYTDSLPLLSLPLKLLSPLLVSEPIQFVGPWLALCFVLQGVFGAVLTSEMSKNPLHAALGGAIFALSPVLMNRVGHDSLCAQWLLLAMLWLNVREGGSVRSTVIITLALVALSATIHPVLWAMTCALAFARVARLRLEGRLGWIGTATLVATLMGLTAALFAAIGYLGSGAPKSGVGFGVYSADLLTLVNPMGTSRFIPELPRGGGQNEGFAYLGLGGLVLLASSVVLLASRRKEVSWTALRPWLPVLIAVVLMAIFSASSTVTLGGHTVLSLRSVYRPFLSLVEPFRSSGRFIWPLHYLAVLGGLAVLLRFWKASGRLKASVLGAVLVLQAVDIRRTDFSTRADDRWNRLRSARWDELVQDRTRVLLHPPQLRSGGSAGCKSDPADWPEEFYLSAGWLAVRHRMALNSGYLARLDDQRAQAYCDKSDQDFRSGELDPSALYIVARSRWDEAQKLPGARCEPLDGYLACVAPPRP